MPLLLLVLFASVVGLVLFVRRLGQRELVNAVSDEAPAWFVALRFRPGETRRSVALPMGIRLKWAASANFTFVGEGACHWDRFLLLAGTPRDSRLPVFLDDHVADAQVVRLRLARPPVMMLGFLRLLNLVGLRRMPSGAVETDPAHTGARADVMPTQASVAELLSCPHDYRPAMVNFFCYRPQALYGEAGGDGAGLSGRRAYGLYGQVAFTTVYRTGGRLVFFGRVEETLREAAGGPTAGAWEDIGVMQYTEPKAILTMEQVPAYRAALRHRDAGLERTVIIASTPDPD